MLKAPPLSYMFGFVTQGIAFLGSIFTMFFNNRLFMTITAILFAVALIVSISRVFQQRG